MGEVQRVGFKMKKIFLTLFFWGVSAWAANSYQITNAISEPVALVAGSQKINLTKKTILDQDFKIQTTDQQFVRVVLNKNYELSVFNNSEIEVRSVYTNADGPSTSVILRHGQVAFQNKQINEQDQSKTMNQILFSSDFFDWNFDQKSIFDFWIKLDNEKPNIEFCNRQKSLSVVLFDHETKANLNSFEGIVFNGEYDGLSGNKKIAFDFLLNGRKIPKGRWQNKTKCSFDKIIQKQKEIEIADHAAKKKADLIVQKKKDIKKNNDSKFLCHKPYGQLHDCAWISINSQCFRTRCNASGEWADSQLIVNDKVVKCSKEYLVRPCDY
jgi:hypothetical protein